MPGAAAVWVFELAKNWGKSSAAKVNAFKISAISGLAFIPSVVHALFIILSNPTGYHVDAPVIRWHTYIYFLFLYISSCMQYDIMMDIILSSILYVTFSSLIIFRYIEIKKEWIVVLLFFGVLSVLITPTLLGVFSMNVRAPTILFALLIPATCFRRDKGGLEFVCVTALLALALIKVLHVSEVWKKHSDEVEQFVSAFRSLPQGAVLLPTVGNANQPKLRFFHAHTASYATIEAGAFVPTNYTGATLLRPTEHMRRLQHPSGFRRICSRLSRQCNLHRKFRPIYRVQCFGGVGGGTIRMCWS
jgi:hypothetical protein